MRIGIGSEMVQLSSNPCYVKLLLIHSIDERWLDWLDSKIALLINRDGVDPRDYGGKYYDEYVRTFTFTSILTPL